MGVKGSLGGLPSLKALVHIDTSNLVHVLKFDKLYKPKKYVYAQLDRFFTYVI